jgi:hypothetical protein
VFGDVASVSSKQGVWCDEPSVAALPGECLGDSTEQRPVVVVQRWPLLLAAQYDELMAQHDDLDVFGAHRPYSEARQR